MTVNVAVTENLKRDIFSSTGSLLHFHRSNCYTVEYERNSVLPCSFISYHRSTMQCMARAFSLDLGVAS